MPLKVNERLTSEVWTLFPHHIYFSMGSPHPIESGSNAQRSKNAEAEHQQSKEVVSVTKRICGQVSALCSEKPFWHLSALRHSPRALMRITLEWILFSWDAAQEWSRNLWYLDKPRGDSGSSLIPLTCGRCLMYEHYG